MAANSHGPNLGIIGDFIPDCVVHKGSQDESDPILAVSSEVSALENDSSFECGGDAGGPF